MTDKIKIMIVETNAEYRDFTRRQLEYEENIEILGFADNGEAAIEQARKLRPHVILMMTMNMPKMNGLQATEIIKREMSAAQIIFFLLANEIHEMRQGLQMGVFECVGKPIPSAELADVIERAFQEFCRAAGGNATDYA